MPPRSPPAARFCRPSSLIHSVIRPTIGSSASPNSLEPAPSSPAVFRAAFDAGHLHAEADAEEGDAALAGEVDAGDLALAAALAEAAGDEDGVAAARGVAATSASGCSNNSASSQLDVDLDPVGEAAVDQRLGQRLVGVLEADIFADHADRDLALPG